MSNEPPALIDADDLAARLGDESIAVIDARFDLGDVTAGREAYLRAHVPGAVYAHLDEDLSGPPVTDRGRHPLPTPEKLEEVFGRLGVGPRTEVVAYDHAQGGAAARVWWLLRYAGHDRVAVLDGGWEAWTRRGHPVTAGEERRPPAPFRARVRRDWLVTVGAVPSAPRLVDARDPARYRGEREPLDPVAGHIPGAVNYFFKESLDAEGRFLPPAQLRRKLEAALGETPPEEAVFYCGSGVTACHGLLALAHAGLPMAKLYAGSWSEWCADAARPVATGPEPGSA